MSLGLQDETNILTTLKQSTSDCVLVKDIHLVSESGLKTLYIQLQRLLARGKSYILVHGLLYLLFYDDDAIRVIEL